MVSKQDKYLRQQAILRAEKYKDEQAKKAASHAPTNNTTVSIKSATSTTASTIETNMSPFAGRESRSPDIAKVFRATPLKLGDSPLPADMTLAKKTLASKKEEPQVPIVSALCDSPNASRKAAEAARSDVQSASTSYKIMGGIESECFALPPSQSPRMPIRTASPVTDRHMPLGVSSSDRTPSPSTSPSHDSSTPSSEHAKKRPSPALRDSDFTFRPMTSISPRTQSTLPPGTPPSFKIPSTTATPARDPMELGSTRGVEPARSIFDVLRDRSRLASSSIPSEVAMPSMATDRVAAVGDDLQQDHRHGQIVPAADLQDGAKARVGTEGLQLAETELNKWQETHKTVPTKFSPAKFDPRLSLLCDDTEATSSSDDIETEFDVEDLAELRRFNSTFTAYDSETICGIVTPATTNSFSDDEDVMELCLRVQTPEAAQITTVDTPASVVIAETPDPNDNLSILLTDDGFDLDCGSGVEISARGLSVASSLRPLIAVMIPDELRGFQPSCVSDAESDQACDFEEAMIDAALVHQIDIAHDLLSSYVVTELTACVEKAENATASEPFSSDWAGELTRLTLGTESLFTFLDRLHTGNNVSAEKPSIVAAFLELVNLERSNIGQCSLPQSYTASAVMASRIIPHTILLGTTTLNTFLSNLTFGTNGEMTIEEVHRVCKALSKEDLHLQTKATTGIMDALGRRLGKLPIV